MQKRGSALPIIVVCVVIVVIVALVSRTQLGYTFGGFVQQPLIALKNSFFHGSKNEVVKNDTAAILKQLVDQKTLSQENQALRDQFENAHQTDPQKLLPAHIVGSPSFVPGVTTPAFFILDRGSDNAVEVGQAVVVNDSLIGKIDTVSPKLSRVKLVIAEDFSFTVKIMDRNANGVIKGEGTIDMLLDNVVLSDTVEVADIVVTRGDVTQDGNGILPNLIVGKVIRVEKKPSALFQTARVKSLVDFTKLTNVFVTSGY